jgi:hypothetical protein
MKVFYMGIESYPTRYSYQLTDWNIAEFKRRNISYHIVEGAELLSVKGKIVNGSVLDAHGRTFYSLNQVASLISLMQSAQLSSKDVIFFEDMFTPGIESLPYILDQIEGQFRPRVFVRCLAQTIDPDDFVHRTGMFPWMRPYELMVDAFVDGILVASEEMVANLRICGFKAPIYVTGLPFGKEEVQSRVSTILPLKDRPKVVAFASRWDTEKQPLFYLEVVKRVFKVDPTIQFTFLSGHPSIKANNSNLARAAVNAVFDKECNFQLHLNLTKNEYYEHLANSRLLFNCALQDWVSNTVSEADALGTQTLFPAYRSFPETFANDRTHMYIPWSIEDAVEKVINLVNTPNQQVGRISDYQNNSISRTIDVFSSHNVSHYMRNSLDYRDHVTKPKF